MVEFSTLIQNWYRQNKRDLPWRTSKNPYRIWLSEIILQQTRVDQGMSYYLKFVDNYPNISDLASASEDEVLNLWQGLGYYSRARNMHFAAKTVMNEFDGKFPDNYKDILSLKGVGEYTAAAVSSIAFNEAHAVVDGNVFRVLARYLGISDPIDSTTGKKKFKEAAYELLDPKDPGTFNQALMELGSLVCTPKNPKCDECPIAESCHARAESSQDQFPVKAKKTKVRKRYFNYLLITDGENLLIKKRGAGDIWQGLYDFPLVESKNELSEPPEEYRSKNSQSTELDGTFTHILSHQKIQAKFWKAEVQSVDIQGDELKIKKENLEDYPLPRLLIRYIEQSEYFGAE